jgi:predicted AlkP superfamily phosphohydrolase/phosphomutase
VNRVLVVGLDACDAAIAEALVGRGEMPVLGDLLRRGGRAELLLPDGLFVGVVWPTLVRGVAPDGTGRHSWIDVDPATYELTSPSVRPFMGQPVWAALDTAGMPVLVVDVPHESVREWRRVTQVVEWACHDHHVGPQTWPPTLGTELEARFGSHPLLGVYPQHGGMHLAPDDYLLRAGSIRTPEEDRAMAALLTPSVGLKAEASEWLLTHHDWNLALVSFGESHAVGHQLWHVHDPGHPRHDPEVRDAAGSPIEVTYRALDEALGRCIGAAGADTNVIVVLTHGMGPHYDAVHLLEELLGRFDRWLDTSGGSVLHHAARRARARWPDLPPGFRSVLAPPAGALLRRRGLRPGESVADPELDADRRRRRRFFRSWNNDVVGGVRLNLRGREAAGTVHPADADALLGWLERQLAAVIDVDRGRPVVHRMYRCADAYPGAIDPTLPDLFVEWHRELPIERVWSPTSGVVHHDVTLWRTGDHQQHSLLVAAGPDIEPGAHLAMPTGSVPAGLTALLGVELPGAQHPPPSWWAV